MANISRSEKSYSIKVGLNIATKPRGRESHLFTWWTNVGKGLKALNNLHPCLGSTTLNKMGKGREEDMDY